MRQPAVDRIGEVSTWMEAGGLDTSCWQLRINCIHKSSIRDEFDWGGYI